MPRLEIDALLANPLVDPRAHLDPERVAHYAQTRDPVAPVVVYETGEGLLLVDGYHRIAAAQQRGATTIEAEIRHGSRHDALRYAAARAAAERGVTAQEAADRIKHHSGRRWGRQA
jgi:ParB-like chromosome segregation protein Spo0J